MELHRLWASETCSVVQRAAVQGPVQELEEEWRKAYFVDCPVKLDTDYVVIGVWV